MPGTALAGAPSNDAYANAEPVGALPATIAGTTIDSTGQTGEKLDVCHFDVPVARLALFSSTANESSVVRPARGEAVQAPVSRS